eukprot:4202958-Pyramimonas_sp.AAC.1
MPLSDPAGRFFTGVPPSVELALAVWLARSFCSHRGGTLSVRSRRSGSYMRRHIDRNLGCAHE